MKFQVKGLYFVLNLLNHKKKYIFFYEEIIKKIM